MVGDVAGELRVGRRAKHARSPRRLPQRLQDPRIIGQGGDVQFHPSRDLALERGFPAQEPYGQQEHIEGVSGDEAEQRLVEQV